MKIQRSTLILLSPFILIAIILSPLVLYMTFYMISAVYFLFPFTDSIVTQGIANDGTEVYVIQAYYNLTEPYRVTLYSRYPEGNWRGMYLEHEDGRWREASLKFDQNQVSVFRQGEFHSTHVLPGAESLGINPGERDDDYGYYYPGSWTVEEIFQHHSERTDS